MNILNTILYTCDEINHGSLTLLTLLTLNINLIHVRLRNKNKIRVYNLLNYKLIDNIEKNIQNLFIFLIEFFNAHIYFNCFPAIISALQFYILILFYAHYFVRPTIYGPSPFLMSGVFHNIILLVNLWSSISYKLPCNGNSDVNNPKLSLSYAFYTNSYFF